MKLIDVIQQVSEFKASVEDAVKPILEQIETIKDEIDRLQGLPKKVVEMEKKKLEKKLQDKIAQVDTFIQARLSDAEKFINGQKEKIENQVKRQVTRSANSLSVALGGPEVSLDDVNKLKDKANEAITTGSSVLRGGAQTLL